MTQWTDNPSNPSYDSDYAPSILWKGAPMPDPVVAAPIPVVITWQGADGLVSRKCVIPWDVWITLKTTSAD